MSLKSIFRGSRWKLEAASTVHEGVQIARRYDCEIPVVICEYRLPDGDWNLMLAEVNRAAVPSSLIVCSRLADERLWLEVLNLGAFDLLLCAPFVSGDVLRATENAWSTWNDAVRPGAVPRQPFSQSHGDSNAVAAGS